MKMNFLKYDRTNAALGSNTRIKNNLSEMKKRIILLLLTGFVAFACNDMDLNPLSQASSDNWYTTENGIEMGVKYLYSNQFWNTNQKDKTAAALQSAESGRNGLDKR